MSDPDQYPSRLAEKIVVRLPDGMRDRLAEAARANRRSTNAEVVARLEDSFASGGLSFEPTEAERQEARTAFMQGFKSAAKEIGATLGPRIAQGDAEKIFDAMTAPGRAKRAKK